MSLVVKIEQDLKAAMLAKDEAKLSVIRFLKSALKYAAIEKKVGALADADAQQVIQRQMKQRRESIEQFKNAGADHLSVHLEACKHLHRNIQQIRSLGMKAGVAINPHTPVSELSDVLADIDLVCMMSVNPGYGGQKFIPHTMEKIKQLRKMIDERGLKVQIEIDGGVTLENASSIIAAGADVLVAGNTVFKSADPKATIAQLKSIT